MIDGFANGAQSYSEKRVLLESFIKKKYPAIRTISARKMARRHLHNHYLCSGIPVMQFDVKVETSGQVIYRGKAFIIEESQSWNFDCKNSNQIFEVQKSNVKSISRVDAGSLLLI